MSKHTKLQIMLGEALDRHPESSDVTAVIDTMATWFEYALENTGMPPAVIPTLLRWQYLQGELMEDSNEPV
jgi:hypothetical protein